MCKFKALLSTPLFLGVTLMAFYACSSEELDSTSLSNGAEVTTRLVVQIEDVCKLSKSEFEFVNQNMNKCLSFDSEANRLSEDESKQLENALSLYSRTDISCMSAVAIGNLAGLGWWLASYSASLAGVVASCS